MEAMTPDMEAIERYVWSVGAEIIGLRDAIRMTDPEDCDGLAATELVDDIDRYVIALMRARMDLTQLHDAHENLTLDLGRTR